MSGEFPSSPGIIENINGTADTDMPLSQSRSSEPQRSALPPGEPSERVDSVQHEACLGDFLVSASLQEFKEQKQAGLVSPVVLSARGEWNDSWALAVGPRKGRELMNQYSRVSILVEHNFTDFVPSRGCDGVYESASLGEIAAAKARLVYDYTGLPAIAEMTDFAIDAPESGSKINKTLQQGYYTRNIEKDADLMIDRVRPISDENRLTRFTCSAAYYDGEIQLVTTKAANVAIAFSGSHHATIATAAALDEIYKQLTKKLSLTLDHGRSKNRADSDDDGESGEVMVGATLLKERIMREGKMLADSIVKVSSFVNHMVDTELMEVCGHELAERLRQTMPNKILTVESTGLIAGMPTARRLGIPLVFARKTRPITISDSYQTTYRSATKGTTSELIVSCEYLESGDRVLIIDDFLAGGSTAEGLFKLAKMAHAKVVGVGVLIEKMSDGGRAFLSGYDVPVESLAKILPGGDKGRITLLEEEPWMSPDARREKKEMKEEVIKAQTEYYSRAEDKETGRKNESRPAPKAKRRGDDDTETQEQNLVADGDINVIRWEDEDQDMFDSWEETLIRENGRS